MVNENRTGFKAGFQGSRNSGVEAVIYPQRGDPVILTGSPERDQPVPLDGRYPSDPHPALIGASTDKMMGASSGSWSLTMKPSRVTNRLFDQVLDDDWVDITFRQHGRRWHVMRGLVDDMRRTRAVTGDGATTEAYTLIGRDFGKIFEVTPVWFSVYTDDAITGGVSLKVFGGAPNIFGNPSQTVKGFLLGFLQELAGVGRATWVFPPGMPNVRDTFAQTVVFIDKAFSNDPERIAISPNYMMPQGTLWQLAQEWSDPDFCELFVDTVPAQSKAADDRNVVFEGGSAPDETEMRIIFRDRPFPTIELGDASPWFNLPLYTIPRQALITDDLGRAGMERFNAFFMAPQIAQEALNAGAIDLYAPLWDTGDIGRHGLRRFDVMSRYAAQDADHLTLSRAQRFRMRDWHCLNPYLLNGTLELGIGMPWVHIGGRAQIPGQRDVDQNETFYVEGVSHRWAFGVGTKTSLQVTRGWVGTDASYMDALNATAFNYQEAIRAQPTEASGGAIA